MDLDPRDRAYARLSFQYWVKACVRRRTASHPKESKAPARLGGRKSPITVGLGTLGPFLRE